MPRAHPVSRSVVTHVRFTPTEIAAARDRAHAAGRPLAVYLREAALRTAPKARAGIAADDLLHQLSRAATALQVMSRTPGPPPIDASTIVGQLTALMRRVAAATERHT